MMPTLEFWIRIPFAAFVILGIWTLFEKEMLLGRVGDWLENHLPIMVNKPLWMCPPCMSSLWGGSIWISTGGDWIWLLPFVLALCGLLRIVSGKLLN